MVNFINFFTFIQLIIYFILINLAHHLGFMLSIIHFHFLSVLLMSIYSQSLFFYEIFSIQIFWFVFILIFRISFYFHDIFLEISLKLKNKIKIKLTLIVIIFFRFYFILIWNLLLKIKFFRQIC